MRWLETAYSILPVWSVNTAEVVFNTAITMQTITATNFGADPMEVYSSIPASKSKENKR